MQKDQPFQFSLSDLIVAVLCAGAIIVLNNPNSSEAGWPFKYYYLEHTPCDDGPYRLFSGLRAIADVGVLTVCVPLVLYLKRLISRTFYEPSTSA